MTREERRRELVTQAQGLRVPRLDELNKPLGNTKLESLRVATDQKLTDKLIGAGIATRFQRRTHLPRKDGRKLPTVVQIHPEGLEPARKRGPRLAAKPTVEELAQLLARLSSLESELLGEKTRALGERIVATKRRLVDLTGEEESNAIRELAELTAARRSIVQTIRRDAFERIANDREFAPRRWLELISPEKEKHDG